jgi:nucleoside-diphosphate-sugar epimerase
MRALVTGAGGFIGQHLVDRLVREGATVRILLRRSRPGQRHSAVAEAIYGDVRDEAAMRSATAGVDTVFHLAASVHLDGSEDTADHFSVNVGGTRALLAAAAVARVRRFIFFSSVKAMGEETSECASELSETAPATAYGKSKLEAEQWVLETGKTNDIHTVCLRLPMVYGPGHKGNLVRLIAAIDCHRFPPLPEVGNRRSMAHVENVVTAALLSAANSTAGGQCYIVTDAHPYSTRELYVSICEALGKRVLPFAVPLWAYSSAARLGDVLKRAGLHTVPLDSPTLRKLVGSAWYTSAKISRDLGYAPRFRLDEALPQMIAAYRAERP